MRNRMKGRLRKRRKISKMNYTNNFFAFRQEGEGGEKVFSWKVETLFTSGG